MSIMSPSKNTTENAGMWSADIKEEINELDMSAVDSFDTKSDRHLEYSISEIVERVDNIYPQAKQETGWLPSSLLALRSLGVIYGDIGTSPLYGVTSVFQAENIVINESNALGVASLIIWSLFMVVFIKYIGLVMRLDNHGEGGIFALLSLIPPVAPRMKNVFIGIALLGSSLVIGDGAITPAISVLSAIQGIEVQAAWLSRYVVPITVVIIIGFFLIQSFGTSKIGVSFGPIMLLWFLSIGIFGIIEISKKPSILAAFSPSYGLKFLFSSNSGGFLVLGTIVLSVTGVEALYADLGHFGKLPIRISWIFVVFPCLILNYLGQSAHLLNHPEDLGVLFYKSVPTPMFWPMLILATLATIIASQAMVSGVFSLLSQAVSFQFFPNVKIVHTSHHQFGQVYIPEINYIMMVLTVGITIGFHDGTHLTSAYGVAVTGVMFLTSIMYIAVMYLRFKTAVWKLMIYGVVFITIDLSFFAACLFKIPNGGWLPITIALVFTAVMWVWKLGREALESNNQATCITYEKLSGLAEQYHVVRIPTIGVFLSSHYNDTPQSVSVLLPRLRSLPSPSIFLTVKFVPVPYVSERDRISFQSIPELDGITHAVAVYGFAEEPRISQLIQSSLVDNLIGIKHIGTEHEIYDQNTTVTYYLTHERLQVNPNRWIGHKLWVAFFGFLLSNSRSKADVFHIPAKELVDIGFMVDL